MEKLEMIMIMMMMMMGTAVFFYRGKVARA
jgi:hypothetical protein